jgi:hypothetical protein
MKQTAVEWLVDWMGKNQYFIGNDLLKAVEQAKEMEKEQIRKAYLIDVYNTKYGFQQYYEDNFKTK